MGDASGVADGARAAPLKCLVLAVGVQGRALLLASGSGSTVLARLHLHGLVASGGYAD